MGDFNAHSSLWGCRDTNVKGRQIEDLISEHNLCLLNDKSHTYLHPATGSYSSLDLTFCSPELASSPSRTGGRIRRLPSCRVVKPHQWTRLFAVGGDS